MKRIGQDVAEKLDYQPGVFTVERHIRGKWVCAKCETLIQAPVPAHIIDKGIPTTGLLAQVLVAKYVDHLPLYRQEAIFGRAGLAISRSTLAQWVGQCGVQLQPLVDALRCELLKHSVLHADETPVAMLKPGNGKTHRAYLWSYCTTTYNATKAVVFDFADSRGGQHARDFLGLPGEDGWHGKLVCDDFSGYKACFEMGVTEAGCLAHARRKFHELWVNHQSPIGERALKFFIQLYDIEREVREMDAAQRKRIRQDRSRPVADALHLWLTEQRKKVPEGSATAKAIDYSLGRWPALTRYIDDGELPADNNWVENQIRPIALGRSNWLFAGSLRAGKRAAAVMSLVHSAKLNGHDPYAYLKDVLERLPTQPASRIDELLPHIAGSPTRRLPDPVGRRQDGITARLRTSRSRIDSSSIQRCRSRSTSCFCVTADGSSVSSSTTISPSVCSSSAPSITASSDFGVSPMARRSATFCRSRPSRAATASTRTPSSSKSVPAVASAGSFSRRRRARSTCRNPRTTCLGRRMTRPWLITARSTESRIHHVAYVEKRNPRSGSNLSIARIRPRLPSAMRSPSGTPFPRCIFATLTTSRRLCSIIAWRASKSPARARAAVSNSCSGVNNLMRRNSRR